MENDLRQWMRLVEGNLTRDEFDAAVVHRFKQNASGSLVIHHGTDSYGAQSIRDEGFFRAGADWPSFFTTNKKEAEDYARIRAKQAQVRNPDAKPIVITLTVPKYAVTKNGAGEIETVPLIPLYFQNGRGYLRDEDIVAAVAKWNPDDPRDNYDAYQAQSGDQTSGAFEAHRQHLDMEVPRIGPDNKPTNEMVTLGSMGFFELLRLHDWLKRKRTPHYKTMRDAVYARGMKLQNDRSRG
jgi:hypothetical protein